MNFTNTLFSKVILAEVHHVIWRFDDILEIINLYNCDLKLCKYIELEMFVVSFVKVKYGHRTTLSLVFSSTLIAWS